MTAADEEAAALIACLAYLETEKIDRGFLAGAPAGAAWRSVAGERGEAVDANAVRSAGSWERAARLEALGLEVNDRATDRGWKTG
jgi:hypothetical protein